MKKIREKCKNKWTHKNRCNNMDNDAFRKLVNTTKSTKEIAREAVEQEFKRKRKDADSSDDEADDSQDDAGNTRKQEGADTTATQKRSTKKKKEDEASLLYRDRAKERREGTNEDYVGAVETAAKFVDSEMSQYLGGDETHTHLVKGLDFALAQKVRRDLGRTDDQDDDDLDRVMTTVQQQQQQQQHQQQQQQMKFGISSTSEAMSIVNRSTTTSSTSMLGKSVVSYLKQQHQEPSSSNNTKRSTGVGFHAVATLAGQTIQRSKVSFSTEACVYDALQAWQVPREHTLSRAQYDDLHGVHEDYPALTSLDQVFLDRIVSSLSSSEKKASEAKSLKKKRKKKKKEKIAASMNVHEVGSNHNDQNGNNVHAIEEEEDQGPGIRIPAPVSKSTVDASNGDDTSDDDDIFADVGEYQPPSEGLETKVVSDKAGQGVEGGKLRNGNTGKGSIFAGLQATVTGDRIGVTHERDRDTNEKSNGSNSILGKGHLGLKNRNMQGQSSKKLIDRDIFGARPTTDTTAPDSARRGVSTSAYGGDYGEDMDVDFDGTIAMRDEDEDGDTTDKKKKIDQYQTEASKEYGGRGHGKRTKPDDGGGF